MTDIADQVIADCGRLEREGFQVGIAFAEQMLLKASARKYGVDRLLPLEQMRQFLVFSGEHAAAALLVEHFVGPRPAPDAELSPEQPTNPTFYDALKERNERMVRVLGDVELPEPTLMTHCHVAVQGGCIIQTIWVTDPITKQRIFKRVALPYNHYLLIARGIVDAHDEQDALELHSSAGDI